MNIRKKAKILNVTNDLERALFFCGRVLCYAISVKHMTASGKQMKINVKFIKVIIRCTRR